jgi:hypothetical protein
VPPAGAKPLTSTQKEKGRNPGRSLQVVEKSAIAPIGRLVEDTNNGDRPGLHRGAPYLINYAVSA